MIRGEFTLSTGEVIPNQFTIAGWQSMLKSAFWESSITWFVGLCGHNPADTVALGQIGEPTIGVHGYARESLALSKLNWPTISLVNNETYIESRSFVFTPTVAESFDVDVNRLFLTDGSDVVAISSPFPDGYLTVSAALSSKYRLYFR